MSNQVHKVYVERQVDRRAASTHARHDRTLAAVEARGERGKKWSTSHRSQQAQIEPVWGNNFGEMQKNSPGSLLRVETPGNREHTMHAYSTREGQRSGSGNASVPARGRAISGREGAAFITARGGNESELETARDTARVMETARDTARGMDTARDTARGMETARDTARGSETDYMSTVEPDTGRSTSSAFEDDLEPQSGAPAYGFPSHRNSTGNDQVGANYGHNSLSRNAGRAPIDRRNAGSRVSDNSSSGRERFAAPPARGVSRDEQYGRRSQHKPAEVHVRRSKYPNPGEGVPAKAQKYLTVDNQKQFVFRQDEVEDIFSYARHNRVEDLERMMDHGVPADVRDDHGNTILLVACQNGHKRALKAALRRGADINARNARGNTALHFCYAFGYGDTLGRYLVDKGASSSIRNRSGMVCFDGIGR